MEKSQYDTCSLVLLRLKDAGVLDHVVIVGSWCVLFYERYFNTPAFRATIRTRDLDIAIPRPPRFHGKVDLAAQLGKLGFVIDFMGQDGYVRFLHPDLIVEFLVPELGRTTSKPFDVPALGVNAQPLRFLSLLLDGSIRVPFQSVTVRVPHPANFALHKLLISGRRQKDKMDRDRQQALMIIRALVATGEGDRLRAVFTGIPKGWQADISRTLKQIEEDGVHALLRPDHA